MILRTSSVGSSTGSSIPQLLTKGVKLIFGSGGNVPLACGSVDTIIYSLSLHHLPEPGQALREAKRVLRDGGRILVLEPETGATTNRMYGLIHNEDDACEKATAAIITSSLGIEACGTYETNWRFVDFTEMAEYLFGYFEMEPDPEIVESMALLLNGDRDSKPLHIKDITSFWLLRPHQGAG